MSSDEIGSICQSWWRSLTDGETGRARADLARLKRAAGVAEALSIRVVHDLNASLAMAGHGLRSRPEKLALIALTLAQVVELTPEPLARRMGRGDPRMLSEIRFSALIRTTEVADLVVPLRRALRATGQKANVAGLARDLYWWNDAARAAWCFDYYGATGAAPEPDQTFEESSP